jgi:hypothetical protein
MSLGNALFRMKELAFIDQAEIDHVDRNFRIKDGLELIPDRFFEGTLYGGFGRSFGGRGFEA